MSACLVLETNKCHLMHRTKNTVFPVFPFSLVTCHQWEEFNIVLEGQRIKTLYLKQRNSVIAHGRYFLSSTQPAELVESSEEVVK